MDAVVHTARKAPQCRAMGSPPPSHTADSSQRPFPASVRCGLGPASSRSASITLPKWRRSTGPKHGLPTGGQTAQRQRCRQSQLVHRSGGLVNDVFWTTHGGGRWAGRESGWGDAKRVESECGRTGFEQDRQGGALVKWAGALRPFLRREKAAQKAWARGRRSRALYARNVTDDAHTVGTG